MNLLLLLSALLSALSGASGVRAAQAPAATLSSTVAKVAEAVTATRCEQASRPAFALPAPARDIARALRSFALPAIVPAFASRRRE